MHDKQMEELLEVSRQLVIALDVDSLIMTEEDKDAIESSRESMSFFMDVGNVSRAITEGRSILLRLENLSQL
jgi:hypothetical protein